LIEQDAWIGYQSASKVDNYQAVLEGLSIGNDKSMAVKLVSNGLVMVGGVVTHPTATPELLVIVSGQAAPQHKSLCHRH
jgi:hypothetical protein